jgi:hypothetical protein
MEQELALPECSTGDFLRGLLGASAAKKTNAASLIPMNDTELKTSRSRIQK